MADNVFCFVLRIIGVVLTGYLFLQGLFTICLLDSAPEHTYFVGNNLWPAVAGIISIVGTGCIAFKIWNNFSGQRKLCWQKRLRRSGSIIAVIVGLACLIWIGIAPKGLYSDQHELVTAAGQMLQGDYRAWRPGGYAFEWPFQNGMILLLAFLQIIFPFWDSAAVLQFLNVGAAIGSALLFSCLLKLKRAQAVKGLLQTLALLLYFPFFLYCTFVYGTLLGFFLVVLSVFFLFLFMDSGKWWNLLAACFFMALAMQIKPNYQIMLIGTVLVLIYESIFKRKFKYFIAAFLMIISVLAVNAMVKATVEMITEEPVAGGNPAQAHIAMGLQEGPKAEGWFNWYNRELFMQCNYDTVKTKEVANTEIKKRLSFFAKQPQEALDFFVRKTASQWNNPTFQCFYIHNIKGDRNAASIVKSIVNDGGRANLLLIYVLDIFQSVIYFGVLTYLVLVKPESMSHYLLIIFFIGAFLFYAVWEAKAQYTMVYFYGLIPYGIAGYVKLCRKLTTPQNKQGCLVYITAIIVLIYMVSLENSGIMRTLFKINGDTESYYSYIYEYNDAFINFRF